MRHLPRGQRSRETVDEHRPGICAFAPKPFLPFRTNGGFKDCRSEQCVVSVHSKRNYAKALDELQAFCLDREAVLSRSVLLEFRAAMLERNLSPSTINVKLSAIRSLIGEARRAGVLGAEDASQMTDIANVWQQGTRLGNWLTREQAKELLASRTVPR